MALAFAVNLLRGTPKFESVVGLSTCDWKSFTILAVFILISVLLTAFNIHQIRKEQDLKRKYGKLHPSELYLTGKNLPRLVLMSFVSAFLGQTFGLGGGFIY